MLWERCVADPYDERDFDLDGRSATPRRTRTRALVGLVSFAALVVIAMSAGWFTYGHLIERGPPVFDPQVAVALQELRERQVQSAQKMEEIDRRLMAAQVDLKNLSDQLSALEIRMKGLQNVWNPLTPEPDAGAQPIMPPRKKPSEAPKSAGPTSLDGAPLTAPAPDESDRK